MALWVKTLAAIWKPELGSTHLVKVGSSFRTILCLPHPSCGVCVPCPKEMNVKKFKEHFKKGYFKNCISTACLFIKILPLLILY